MIEQHLGNLNVPSISCMHQWGPSREILCIYVRTLIKECFDRILVSAGSSMVKGFKGADTPL